MHCDNHNCRISGLRWTPEQWNTRHDPRVEGKQYDSVSDMLRDVDTELCIDLLKEQNTELKNKVNEFRENMQSYKQRWTRCDFVLEKFNQIFGGINELAE